MIDVDNSSRHVPEHSFLRRLSVLREPGNKNRLITLGDFWSQNALLPFHDEIMSILKSIPEDCTYVASEQLDTINKISQGRYTTCFDLKEFTNLLPLSLQKRVIYHLTGDQQFTDD